MRPARREVAVDMSLPQSGPKVHQSVMACILQPGVYEHVLLSWVLVIMRSLKTVCTGYMQEIQQTSVMRMILQSLQACSAYANMVSYHSMEASLYRSSGCDAYDQNSSSRNHIASLKSQSVLTMHCSHQYARLPGFPDVVHMYGCMPACGAACTCSTDRVCRLADQCIPDSTVLRLLLQAFKVFAPLTDIPMAEPTQHLL